MALDSVRSAELFETRRRACTIVMSPRATNWVQLVKLSGQLAWRLGKGANMDDQTITVAFRCTLQLLNIFRHFQPFVVSGDGVGAQGRCHICEDL